jgi:hypothetical protein
MIEEKDSKNCLIVLGMHRSGTSAIAGILHLLGITLGERLTPPDEEVNAKGYWEHADINVIHEKILAHLGSGWFDALPLPDGWRQKIDVAPFQEELAELIRRDFDHTALWAVKDPRLCRLLPLWLQAQAQSGSSPACLLMLRHPVEVAASLHKRDGISLPHALLLWLRYTLESERNSRHLPRVIVTYEDLLANWRATMIRVENQLHLRLNVGSELAIAQVDEFLDSKLRHHIADSLTNSDDLLLKLAMETYQALGMNDFSRLDQYASRMEVLVSGYSPWLEETNHFLSQIRELQSQIRGLQPYPVQVYILEQEIRRIKTSLSWNVTKPLRAAQNIFKRIGNKTRPS